MSCDCNTLVVGEAGPQGPQGLAGTNGTNGTNGINAFTTVAANFTQPSESATVTFTVVDNQWIAIGQAIYISQAGFYLVTMTNGTTSVTANLLKQDGVAPTGTVTSGKKVSPSSVATYSGPLSSLTVNISPATTNLNGPVTVNQSGASNGNFRSYGATDNSLLYVNAATDKVGIGISSPATKLHVSGDFQVGVALSSGGGSLASFTKGATFNSLQGATGFTATDVLIKTQNVSDTFFVKASTDRVGLGTLTPSRLLDIDGTGQTKAWIVNPGAVANPDGDTYVFKVWGSGNTTPLLITDATNNRVGVNTASPSHPLHVVGSANISGNFLVSTSSISCLFVDVSSNKIGINTSSPSTSFHVVGSSLFVGNAGFSNNVSVSGTIVGLSSATISSIVTSSVNVKTGLLYTDATNLRVGISTIAPTRTLSVDGSSDFSGNLYVNDNVFVVDTVNNRVGINTSSPSTDLEVLGSVKISSNLGLSGILTTSGSATLGHNLTVTGDSRLNQNLYVDTSTLIVDATNNHVGINVSPALELHVSGAVQGNSYQIEASAGKLTKFYYGVSASSLLNLPSTSGLPGSSQTFSTTIVGASVGDMVLPSFDTIPATSNFDNDVILFSKVVSSDTVYTTVTNTNASGADNTYTDTVRFRLLVIRATAS